MRFLILLSLAALAGCTQGSGRYPSLLPRPIESQSMAEPERPVPVATPDAALDARVAELGAALDAAGKDFATGAQDAEARIAVARGLPIGSDPWLDAQTALTNLARLRGTTLRTLNDLEELAIARGAAGQPPYPALDAAIAAADKAAATQQDHIGTLEAALAGA